MASAYHAVIWNAYSRYWHCNDEDVHDRVGNSQRQLIVQSVGTVLYDVDHSAPCSGQVATTVENENKEERDRPCNDQNTHDCDTDGDACPHSGAENTTVKHDEA